MRNEAGGTRESAVSERSRYRCITDVRCTSATCQNLPLKVGHESPLTAHSQTFSRLVGRHSLAAGSAGCRFTRSGQSSPFPFDPELNVAPHIPASIRREGLRERPLSCGSGIDKLYGSHRGAWGREDGLKLCAIGTGVMNSFMILAHRSMGGAYQKQRGR